MRAKPERTAWFILWSALFVFIAIIVGVPVGVRHYVVTAEDEQPAILETLMGTVVIDPIVGVGPTPVTKDQTAEVSEGTIIYVDETSEAVVTFADMSFMHLYPGTTVQLDELRAPRYRWGTMPHTVSLTLIAGKIRLSTVFDDGSGLDYSLNTSMASAQLSADGSYTIEVDSQMASIDVYRGTAVVSAQSATVALGARERSEIMAGSAPSEAMSVAKDMITNGSFRDSLESTWQIYNDQGTDAGEADGTVTVLEDEGRTAVQFERSGGYGNHCETIMEQTIDELIPDTATSLVIRASVKVRSQSLSGGGYLSSEYPLMLRITYRDSYDSEAEWIQGFYIENPSNTPTMYGTQITADQWYPYESENLLDSLPVPPYRILSIRIYASGWDYESLVSDVALVAE